jgi:conjugal transfer pilin signal peptidase TrbI
MTKPKTSQHTKLDSIILWFGLTVLTLLYLSQAMSIAINTTGSLPQHVFLVIKHQPLHRGDYVAFYPPPNPFYAGHQLFIKRVAGIAGDKVKRQGHCFYVHSNRVNQRIGIAKPQSRRGIPLHLGKTGHLEQGEYFVYTPHPDSFDSRYQELGWVKEVQVAGRAFPLF